MPTPAIADLADAAAIADLKYRFGEALDSRAFDALGAIFTDTVDVDLAAIGGPAGPIDRDALAALYRHAFRHPQVRTLQAYANVRVTVDGDRATMSSLLHGHHAGPGFPGGETFDIRARYRDRLVRTADGWRIEATALEVVAIAGNPALIA